MGLLAAGSIMAIVCAVALTVTKTNLVPFVKQRWNMQPYEAVESERPTNSTNSIPLQNIKVDSEGG